MKKIIAEGKNNEERRWPQRMSQTIKVVKVLRYKGFSPGQNKLCKDIETAMGLMSEAVVSNQFEN